ncbi:hypothetical protein [Nesterenkonia ebinurensis]|uniref:hypothetical protein n=1 Tax=Nesterenkonia ebinurensis TaxID=2608252 RepID=UPI001CC4DACC|nr:hypothetical protein [Nesterenkonia ebinurensis]
MNGTEELIRIGVRMQPRGVLIYVGAWMVISLISGLALTYRDLSLLPLGVNILISLAVFGLLLGTILWVNIGHYAFYNPRRNSLAKGRTELGPRDVQRIRVKNNVAAAGYYLLLQLSGPSGKLTLKLAGTGREQTTPEAARALQQFLTQVVQAHGMDSLPRGTLQAEQQMAMALNNATNNWQIISPVVAEKFIRTALLESPTGDDTSSPPPPQDVAAGPTPAAPTGAADHTAAELDRQYLKAEDAALDHLEQVRTPAWHHMIPLAIAVLGLLAGGVCLLTAAITESNAWGLSGMGLLVLGATGLWFWALARELQRRKLRRVAVEWFQSQSTEVQAQGIPPALQLLWTQDRGHPWMGVIFTGYPLGGLGMLIGILMLIWEDDPLLQGTAWILITGCSVLVAAAIFATYRYVTRFSRAAAELAPYTRI